MGGPSGGRPKRRPDRPDFAALVLEVRIVGPRRPDSNTAAIARLPRGLRRSARAGRRTRRRATDQIIRVILVAPALNGVLRRDQDQLLRNLVLGRRGSGKSRPISGKSSGHQLRFLGGRVFQFVILWTTAETPSHGAVYLRRATVSSSIGFAISATDGDLRPTLRPPPNARQSSPRRSLCACTPRGTRQTPVSVAGLHRGDNIMPERGAAIHRVAASLDHATWPNLRDSGRAATPDVQNSNARSPPFRTTNEPPSKLVRQEGLSHDEVADVLSVSGPHRQVTRPIAPSKRFDARSSVIRRRAKAATRQMARRPQRPGRRKKTPSAKTTGHRP